MYLLASTYTSLCSAGSCYSPLFPLSLLAPLSITLSLFLFPHFYFPPHFHSSLRALSALAQRFRYLSFILAQHPSSFGSFSCEGCIPDTANNFRTVRELYEASNDTDGKHSVPVLWDEKVHGIVGIEMQLSDSIGLNGGRQRQQRSLGARLLSLESSYLMIFTLSLSILLSFSSIYSLSLSLYSSNLPDHLRVDEDDCEQRIIRDHSHAEQ